MSDTLLPVRRASTRNLLRLVGGKLRNRVLAVFSKELTLFKSWENRSNTSDYNQLNQSKLD